ncbi:MAG: Outer membrane lipoprotein Blc precursor [Syntrophorhabdus sp. PtaB.Bin047]|nr:MAG: Outer membrane lipoprotein Blc precursor [Syntrophorhabdus sp. PtaB.Bin047]
MLVPGAVTYCLVTLLLTGCAGIPDGVEAVKGFDANRYLGTWYEIARLDHPFERGLTKVRAEYALRDDGGISVMNTGFDRRNNVWKKATGKAHFVEGPDVGRLKVSFFGPFYGGYNILELDRDYSYALVCGPSRKYLWILARRPEMEETVKAALVEKARKLGFDTDRLIFVEHQE